MENKDDLKRFGNNLRALRKAYGDTQERLADAIGVKHNSISNYEKGKSLPTRESLTRIAKRYHVVENELLYSDISQLQSVTHCPVEDREYSGQMLDRLFPILHSSLAMENEDFKKAYMLHQDLLEQMKNQRTLNETLVNKCIGLYKKAHDANVIEGTANWLWWLMLEGLFTTFCSPRFLESLDIFGNSKITMEFWLENSFKVDFSNEDAEGFDSSKNIREFLTNNEIDLIVCICLLKRSKEYADLGDYYLALRHLLGLLTNSLTREMNFSVGIEMLNTYALIGNPYAKRWKIES